MPQNRVSDTKYHKQCGVWIGMSILVTLVFESIPIG